MATQAGKKDATSGTKSSLTAKSNADVAIPYDAAARLAYDEYCAGGKEADFEAFKLKYEQMTVADIKAKQIERELFPETQKVGPDLSIPYDAAAKLAYEQWLDANGKWGNEAEYEKFKSKYEEKSVAQATYKKLEREMA